MRPARAIVLVAVCAPLVVTQASASQLSQTIGKGNRLIALNRLAITAQQIDKLLPLSQRLADTKKSWQEKRTALLTADREALAQARAARLAGRTPSETTAAAMAKLDESLTANDDELYAAAATILESIRAELLPQQNAYINWTPPKATAASSRQTFLQRAEEERERRAMLLFAEQFLTRIRYYPLENYIIQAEKLVDDFLRPLIDPASPAYPQAKQFMFRLVEQVRLVPEPQWEQEGMRYAELLVGELGLDREAEPVQEDRPYSWQDMYEVFSDPGTPALLQEIKQARAGRDTY